MLLFPEHGYHLEGFRHEGDGGGRRGVEDRSTLTHVFLKVGKWSWASRALPFSLTRQRFDTG